MNKLTERDKDTAARLMRDSLMEKQSTHLNWENCKEGWTKTFERLETMLAEHDMHITRKP